MLSEKEKARKRVQYFQDHLHEALKEKQELNKTIIVMIFTVLTLIALAFFTVR